MFLTTLISRIIRDGVVSGWLLNSKTFTGGTRLYGATRFVIALFALTILERTFLREKIVFSFAFFNVFNL